MKKHLQSSANIDDQSHAETVQLLEHVAVFSVLTDKERAKLAAKARSVAYGTGEFIVRQGDSGHSLFIIQDGVCEVFIRDQQGYGKRVAQLERGGFFGEMSLLTGEPHTATVRAVENVTLVAIDKAIFASILKANPEISQELGKILLIRQKELAAMAGNSGYETDNSSNMIARIKGFFRIN